MTTHETNVDLWVCVNDNKLDEYLHEGRSFIQGKAGAEYALRIKNRNPHRVKVIVTVDGVSVISGKPSAGEQTEQGYVIAAHDTLTIRGYRLDSDNVAAFRFTKQEGSYAKESHGMEGTTGVIGVKVFKEKVAVPVPPVVIEKHIHHHDDPWWPYRPYPLKPWYWEHQWYTQPVWCGSTAAPQGSVTNGQLFRNVDIGGTSIGATAQSATVYNCSMGTDTAPSIQCCAQNASAPVADAIESAAPNPFTLGSTFGAKTESKVTEVGFEVDYALGVVLLFYTDRAGLAALGIDLTKRAKVTMPAAFDSQYARPPANWQG